MEKSTSPIEDTILELQGKQRCDQCKEIKLFKYYDTDNPITGTLKKICKKCVPKKDHSKVFLIH